MINGATIPTISYFRSIIAPQQFLQLKYVDLIVKILITNKLLKIVNLVFQLNPNITIDSTMKIKT